MSVGALAGVSTQADMTTNLVSCNVYSGLLNEISERLPFPHIIQKAIHSFMKAFVSFRFQS